MYITGRGVERAGMCLDNGVERAGMCLDNGAWGGEGWYVSR